jgi:uncharacterized protein DUF4838
MRWLICVVAAVLVGGAAMAEDPIYRAEPTGEFMREWLLCGPFPNPHIAEDRGLAKGLSRFGEDFLAAHGGETNPRLAVGQNETFDGGQTATWFAYSSPDEIINLDEAITKDPEVLAYAYCEINVPEDRACILSIGSNDGIRVWLNGEVVIESPAPRGLQRDQDLAPVVLQRGRNTLLLKIEEWGNLWQFCCRLRPLDLDIVNEFLWPFSVSTAMTGKPTIRPGYPVSAAKAIIEEAAFEVVDVRNPELVVWKRKWNKREEQPIHVDTKTFGKYMLRGAVAFKGGETFAFEQPFTAGPRVEHVLFAKGKTDYRIVVGADASESERWAAEELAHWLGEVSGVTFPVVDETDDGEPAIVVGINSRAETLLGKKIVTPEAGDESFVYRSAGSNILIYGGSQRGTMYGVFSFLERELGCRWYSPKVSVAPKRPAHAFDYLHHAEAPGIRVRNDFYYEAFEPVWAARNRINGALGYREQIGGVEPYWAVHTFERLVPVKEFWDTHPEYFSEINGERTDNHTQLCLTNEEVLRIAIERLKQVMRDEPQFLIYSVSQNDWRNPCECAPCQAIAVAEDSEAGPLIHFVNQVADAVKDEFPDKFIGTLAYQYTRKPPRTIEPRENVVVRLCSIECCFSHDFLSCPENQTFVEDARGWAEVAPHVYVWDYVVNFSHYIQPFPNFSVLQSNIQFFRDHKAIGIMEQAAYQSRGGEFAELKMNVIARLLWDPETDVNYWIDDFMYGYYGRAGQHVRRYFDLIQAQVTDETHMTIRIQPKDKLFSDAFVRDADAIFDEAETVADSEEIRQRVEMARLPLMYLKCRRDPEGAVRDGTYARFSAIVEREGITNYAEAGAPHREAFHDRLDGIAARE